MKIYFSFNLTGKKLFPIWILYLVLFIAPYTALIFQIKNVQDQSTPPGFIFPILILLIVIAFILMFYFIKLTIGNIAYRDKSIAFKGTFGNYFGTVLLGLFLTIITLSVYLAWFIRNLHRFFINNSSYDSHPFKFMGKGGKLFVILLLTLYLPLIALSIVMVKLTMSNPDLSSSAVTIQQLVMLVIMIPYIYLVYKWMVNTTYKGFAISWKTKFWNSCGKIAVEMVLSIITIGIYMPLAMIRLYNYFAGKTIADADDRKLRFGYDIDQFNDFLFIWGQILLTIITLSIYFPWAFCKIGNRILSKTYLQGE